MYTRMYGIYIKRDNIYVWVLGVSCGGEEKVGNGGGREDRRGGRKEETKGERGR